jgi:MscS family membrane protein
LGRIVLDRKTEDPGKGQWLFTTETIGRIESMFLAVRDQPLNETQRDATDVIKRPRFWETPGIWVRLHLPGWLQVRRGHLDLYQWLGLVLAGLLSWVGARLVMVGVTRLIARFLHRSGSALSTRFVASSLKPFTWLGAVWLFFLLLGALDLTVAVAGTVFAIHKFLLAGLFGWLGLRFIDLFLGIYTNSELLRPHRNLGDMIVPVAMRLSKTTVLLVVATFMIYQVGELELLGRFLTALGVAGLAASLAAQDAMKSFFGTLLLIGERAFKIGDWIIVGDKEGMVEQVGFRSTRLRTADDSLLTIPNSVIAGVAIDNMGARILRRLTSNFVIGSDTGLEQVAEFRNRLQAWLTRQTLVVQEKVDLHVHQFTASGVELRLVLFLTAKTSREEIQFRHALHCEILQIVKDLEVTLAPAQRTVLLPEAGELPNHRDAQTPAKAA